LSEHPRRLRRRRGREDGGVAVVTRCAERKARKDVRSGMSAAAAGGAVATRVDITRAAFRGGAAISERQRV